MDRAGQRCIRYDFLRVDHEVSQAFSVIKQVIYVEVRSNTNPKQVISNT